MWMHFVSTITSYALSKVYNLSYDGARPKRLHILLRRRMRCIYALDLCRYLTCAYLACRHVTVMVYTCSVKQTVYRLLLGREEAANAREFATTHACHACAKEAPANRTHCSASAVGAAHQVPSMMQPIYISSTILLLSLPFLTSSTTSFPLLW
jgi:hypothetical protein